MSVENGQILRPEFNGINPKLIEVLGRLSVGINLFVVSGDLEEAQAFPQFTLGNFNVTLESVARLISPNPEIPVAITTDQEDKKAEMAQILSSRSHLNIISLEFDKKDRDGESIGMSSLIAEGGFFIKSDLPDKSQAIVRFATFDNSERVKNNEPDLGDDIAAFYELQEYFQNLGTKPKQISRIIGMIKKVGASLESYPDQAFSKKAFREAFESGRFSTIPGLNQKDFSYLLKIIKHISPKQD